MKTRILHLVSGGGSGATRVALDLACAQHEGTAFAPLVVFRRRHASLPPEMAAQVAACGLPIEWVEDLWPKFRIIEELAALCKRFEPQAFLAHGYSEHLWGRRAALLASVPAIVHVEHNFERYQPWRLPQVKRLAPRTDLTICVSNGVAARVKELGIGGKRVVAIFNGTDMSRFAESPTRLAERAPDIVMPARFARQKDHLTLIRAVRRLADGGWKGRLVLAGGGKDAHKRASERLVEELRLGEQVVFPGQVSDVPTLLRSCRVMALSTRYEGFGLVLTEAMAAGCAVVASNAPGVRDIMRERENGWLFPIGNDEAAANALSDALSASDAAQARADCGRTEALNSFSRERMVADYEQALLECLASSR